MAQQSTSLGTVRRAFDVVDALRRLNRAGPTEVAAHLDVPTSTAHDYLRSLSETPYVSRVDGEYELSYNFLTVGGKMKHRNRLFQVAKPEMKKLAAETDEFVGLNIEHEGQTLVLHQEGGERALSLGTYPGMVHPLHTLATGKAILAHLPPDRITEILDGELIQRTEYTTTDPDDLRAELETVRERGHAIDWDEQVVGMGMVAVPILVDEDIIGAIGVLCPTGRLQNESYRDELLEKLYPTADRIRINYQYR